MLLPQHPPVRCGRNCNCPDPEELYGLGARGVCRTPAHRKGKRKLASVNVMGVSTLQKPKGLQSIGPKLYFRVEGREVWKESWRLLTYMSTWSRIER